jgi:hypothetical protein
VWPVRLLLPFLQMEVVRATHGLGEERGKAGQVRQAAIGQGGVGEIALGLACADFVSARQYRGQGRGHRLVGARGKLLVQ